MANQKIIEEVLDGFDFAKVQAYMQSAGWGWQECGGPPSVAALVREATRMLKYVMDSEEDPTSLATGGLEAVKMGGELSLRFILEENWRQCQEEDDNVK